MFHSLINLMVW